MDNFTGNGSELSSGGNGTGKIDVGITQWELWIQLIVFYLCMAAIGGTTLNTYAAVCIIQTKRLRSRFYAIVCFWMFTRASLGFQYIFMSIYRILRTLNMAPSSMPQIACHSLHFFLYYSTVTEVFLLVFLVIDRIVAIAKPTFYRLLSVRQAVLISAGILIVNLFITQMPSYIGVSFTEVIVCVNVLSPLSEGFKEYREQAPLALIALLLALQFAAIGLTWYKMRQMRQHTGDVEQAVFIKRQVALMAAIRNMIFGHAGLIVLVRVYMLCAVKFPQQSARFVAIAGITQTFDDFTGVIVLLCSKRELRRACRLDCYFRPSRIVASVGFTLGMRNYSQSNTAPNAGTTVN